MRCRLVLILVVLTAPSIHVFGQEAAVRGFILDDETGEPLAAANVLLEALEGRSLGTTSNADGYFIMTGVTYGEHALAVSILGYALYRDTLSLDSSMLTLEVRLSRSTLSMDEVLVTAERAGQTVASAGLQTVTPREIELVPTPDVSGDLMAYLQILPGVLSPGDRGGQLFVRGGTPAQNLVLIDGMPLYQPFHIVGFFSAFPSEIINTADIYSGGFGAPYGGRLSAVLDIATRNGNKHRYQASFSAATFLSAVHVEGPLSTGKSSFLVSIRESLAERLFPSSVSGDLPFTFGDAFVKTHTNLSDGNQLSISFINSHDSGRIDASGAGGEVRDLLDNASGDSDEVKWGNTALGLRLVSIPERAPIFGELTGSISRFTNQVGVPDDPDRRSSTLTIRAAAKLSHQIGRHELRWGATVQLVNVDYELDGVFQDVDDSDDGFGEAGPFVDFLYEPSGNFRLNAGLHLFLAAGNQVQLLPEPRFRASWFPFGFAADHELSAAVGLYHQTMVGLRDDRDAGDVFTAWTFAEYDRPIPSAQHLIVGWRSGIRSTVELGIEGYYKALSDLSVPSWSAFPRFTTSLEEASGDVYGLDMRVSVSTRLLNLFVGYGLQRVEYETTQRTFSVWFGTGAESYNPPHDRRHQLNVVASTSIFGLADLDVRWEYGSGLPFTQPIGFDDWVMFDVLEDVTTASGEYRVLFDRPYQGRLPSYHRLDLSATRAFDLSSGTLTLQAGLFNAYDRANLFYFDVWTLSRIDQMALLPSFGIKFETR